MINKFRSNSYWKINVKFSVDVWKDFDQLDEKLFSKWERSRAYQAQLKCISPTNKNGWICLNLTTTKSNSNKKKTNVFFYLLKSNSNKKNGINLLKSNKGKKTTYTVFSHIVSTDTILFWIWKSKGHSTLCFLLNVPYFSLVLQYIKIRYV